MKKFLTITLLAIAGLFALPQSAEAGSSSLSITYKSGHAACGCPIYTKRVVVGWDHLRRPIYRYYSVPVAHRCTRTTCTTRPVLRTSSCGPWIVRQTYGTRCAPTPPTCGSRWSSHHHSSTIVRIRTCRP